MCVYVSERSVLGTGRELVLRAVDFALFYIKFVLNFFLILFEVTVYLLPEGR